ncbi:hypothetical protein SDC9_167739 [bioreactor metagenome]|uniref:Uncharacterized protein n=1 Tax=bioreactor metagenome TaxID=1076179 RepID=A0A645G0L0_9ZZZZ
MVHGTCGTGSTNLDRLGILLQCCHDIVDGLVRGVCFHHEGSIICNQAGKRGCIPESVGTGAVEIEEQDGR